VHTGMPQTMPQAQACLLQHSACLLTHTHTTANQATSRPSSTHTQKQKPTLPGHTIAGLQDASQQHNASVSNHTHS
jgi:hypothetical protein